jgi:hypothetical protein
LLEGEFVGGEGLLQGEQDAAGTQGVGLFFGGLHSREIYNEVRKGAWGDFIREGGRGLEDEEWDIMGSDAILTL